MKGIAQVLLALVFVGVGIAGWFSEVDGFHQVLGWPSILCWIVASFTAWIPLLGTTVGIWGAHAAWGWDWLPSLALFFGTQAVFVVIVAVATAIDKFRRRPA